MAELKTGDPIVDEEGDRGIVLIATPDSYGYIVWLCTVRGSKMGKVGAYYNSRPDELTLLPDARQYILSLIDGFDLRCSEEDRTDSGDAWEMFNAIRAVLGQGESK